MVGTLPPQGCGVSYDGDNEGHGGFLVTNVANQNQLVGWLSATNPNIVIMHFGTNDVWNNIAAATILTAYSKLVDQMRANNPNMKILVRPSLSSNPAASSGLGLIGPQNRLPKSFPWTPLVALIALLASCHWIMPSPVGPLLRLPANRQSMLSTSGPDSLLLVIPSMVSTRLIAETSRFRTNGTQHLSLWFKGSCRLGDHRGNSWIWFGTKYVSGIERICDHSERKNQIPICSK